MWERLWISSIMSVNAICCGPYREDGSAQVETLKDGRYPANSEMNLTGSEKRRVRPANSEGTAGVLAYRLWDVLPVCFNIVVLTVDGEWRGMELGERVCLDLPAPEGWRVGKVSGWPERAGKRQEIRKAQVVVRLEQ